MPQRGRHHRGWPLPGARRRARGALDADGDGTVTVKYLYRGGNDQFYDPSLTDVWVSQRHLPRRQTTGRRPSGVGHPGSTRPPTAATAGSPRRPRSRSPRSTTSTRDPAIQVALDGAQRWRRTTAPPPCTRTAATSSATPPPTRRATPPRWRSSRSRSGAPVPSFGDFPTGEVQEGKGWPGRARVPGHRRRVGRRQETCTITGWSSAVGAHTLTQVVVDKAGNRASADPGLRGGGDRQVGPRCCAGWRRGARPRRLDDVRLGRAPVGHRRRHGRAGGLRRHRRSPRPRSLAATEGVQQAVAALAERGDPTALRDPARRRAGRLPADLSGYTDASASVFQAALADADAIRPGPRRQDAGAARTPRRPRLCRAALDGLVARPAAVDRSVLQQVHDEARGGVQRRTTRFTADSWARLQAAHRGSAGGPRRLRTRTQAQVDAAAAALTAAVAGPGAGPRRAAPADPVPVKVTLNQDRLRLARGQSLRLEEGVHDAEGGCDLRRHRGAGLVEPEGRDRQRGAGS